MSSQNCTYLLENWQAMQVHVIYMDLCWRFYGWNKALKQPHVTYYYNYKLAIDHLGIHVHMGCTSQTCRVKITEIIGIARQQKLCLAARIDRTFGLTKIGSRRKELLQGISRQEIKNQWASSSFPKLLDAACCWKLNVSDPRSTMATIFLKVFEHSVWRTLIFGHNRSKSQWSRVQLDF